MYVLNDGTDKYDDPKEEVKISDNPIMYLYGMMETQIMKVHKAILM